MGWMPDGIEVRRLAMLHDQSQAEKGSMEKATIIGIDLAKRVFQVPGGGEGRPAVLRKKVSRAQLLGSLAKQLPAVVAMEACATAHDWGRAISGLGRDVRLVPPIYVKPFEPARRTTPPTLRRSPRRPQGQRCALWR